MQIKFIPSSLEVHHLLDSPAPAKHSIPVWYKKLESFDQNKMYDSNGSTVNNKLKMCMPFFDAISGGYIQKTWCDISIRKINGEIKLEFAHTPEIIGSRPWVSVPLSSEYVNLEFYWLNPWIPKLPSGYSLLISHPLNRFDLPFTTTSGIIDSDVFFHSGFGQVPFYLKQEFEGIIPAGTPMYQLIPIKRDSWKSVKEEFNETEQRKRAFSLLKTFWRSYQSKFWHKKNYD